MMDTAQTVTIVEQAIAGVPADDIAKAVGISKRHVYRKLQAPEIKEMIDSATSMILGSSLDRAVSNVQDVIGRYGEFVSSGAHHMVALSLKYSAKLLESVGILPSPAPSYFIQQVNQSITVNEVSPALLARLQGNDTTPDVIDVEYEDG